MNFLNDKLSSCHLVSIETVILMVVGLIVYLASRFRRFRWLCSEMPFWCTRKRMQISGISCSTEYLNDLRWIVRAISGEKCEYSILHWRQSHHDSKLECEAFSSLHVIFMMNCGFSRCFQCRLSTSAARYPPSAVGAGNIFGNDEKSSLEFIPLPTQDLYWSGNTKNIVNN